MTTLTITLENDLEQQVEQFAGEFDLSLEEAATELIRRNADIQKLRALRRRGKEYAQKASIEDEQDIFESVQEWRSDSKEEGSR
jgi:predicted transcriptional regulator